MMKTQILEQAEDDRAMLAHCKSLLAFEQKGGFAMVEDADWACRTILVLLTTGWTLPENTSSSFRCALIRQHSAASVWHGLGRLV